MHFAYVSLPNESDQDFRPGEGYVLFQHSDLITNTNSEDTAGIGNRFAGEILVFAS